MGSRSPNQKGATGWRFWIPLSLFIAAYITSMTLKAMDHGASLLFGVLVTLGYMAAIAVYVVVSTWLANRNDTEAPAQTGGAERT